MKVTVDVDCTPEEARRFLGLPDLSAGPRGLCREDEGGGDRGADARNVRRDDEGWGPMSEAGMDMWKQMLGQMGGKSDAERPLGADTIFALVLGRAAGRDRGGPDQRAAGATRRSQALAGSLPEPRRRRWRGFAIGRRSP